MLFVRLILIAGLVFQLPLPSPGRIPPPRCGLRQQAAREYKQEAPAKPSGCCSKMKPAPVAPQAEVAPSQSTCQKRRGHGDGCGRQSQTEPDARPEQDTPPPGRTKTTGPTGCNPSRCCRGLKPPARTAPPVDRIPGTQKRTITTVLTTAPIVAFIQPIVAVVLPYTQICVPCTGANRRAVLCVWRN